MVINKKLIEAAKYNPTKQTFQMNTRNLCEKIAINEIVLPLYQRDVCWTINKAVDLLNYQLNGKAPVSPISVNKITSLEKDCVPQISFIDRELIENIEPGLYSVTDGQQRLTTNFKAYINHDDFRSIVLDLAKGKFVLVSGSIKRYQIPVGVLLNKEDEIFYSYIQNNSVLKRQDAMSLLVQIRSKLRDYNYTINIAENLSEDEQIFWFEVLNNAGSRVSRVQMSFSKLKIDQIDIYVQYTKPYLSKLEERGLDLFDVKTTEVSIPIANLNSAYELITERSHSFNYAPIPSDTKDQQLCNLKDFELKKCFEITLTALDRTLNFIDSEELNPPDRIDYITYLTGFFVFQKGNELTDERTQSLKNWYNSVVFKNKSNGQRRKIFEDLLKI